MTLVSGVIPAFIALMSTGQDLDYSTMPTDDKGKDENRAKMLFNVYQTWIVGALKANLFDSDGIPLGLELRPDTVMQHVEYGEYQLPDDSRSIEQIYHDMNGQLLILGEPASGKTILVLQLAEKLLGRAQADRTHPIPAVFNLSSWGKDQPKFDEWLVGQLKQSYGVPKKTGKRWIADNRLTLLLDGLDEIAPSGDFMVDADVQALEGRAIELRSACIEAINKFQQAHPDVDIVVCSRIRDYAALTQKLDLNSAIRLHALTDEQIEHYLIGDNNQGIRDLLEQEASAKKMAESPFLLTLMKTAYANIPYTGAPFNQLKLANSDESSRKNHLFGTYANKQINSSQHQNYSHENIRHWLSWLAWQMVEHKTFLFYIEDFQPSWTVYERRYRLLFGLLFGLSGGLLLGLIFGLLFGLSGGLIFGLLGWFSGIEFAENINISINKNSLIVGLIFVLLFGLSGGLIVGLIVVLLFGLLGWLIFGLNTTANLDLRLKPNTGFFISLKNSLIVGLIFGLIIGPFFGLIFGLSGGLSGGLMYGLSGGGGMEVIQHMILRGFLANENVIPRWRYDKFLDHCAELGLLRKVGGGYIFRHRLLLEYFAEQFTKHNPEHVEQLIEQQREESEKNV